MVGDVAQTPITQLEHCRSNPVKPQNIPNLLKGLPNWVVWKAFDEKPDARFAKVPIYPLSGRKINHLDKGNQMTFEAALEAHQEGSGNGIGIVLTGETVTRDDAGEPLYLIGVDLDKVEGSDEKLNAAKAICKSIGSYAEISPSGTGIRIFALSKEPVGKGQSPSGEMYHAGRFLTVTGHGHLREVVTATDQLKALEKQWWLEKAGTERTSNNRSSDSPAITAFRRSLYKIEWPTSGRAAVLAAGGYCAQPPRSKSHGKQARPPSSMCMVNAQGGKSWVDRFIWTEFCLGFLSQRSLIPLHS